ncbi:MAG: hypothetical protein H5U04_09770 [Firmicutes bacterium]|nr:hypothetical protein [Bacillota bacterium]
MSGQPRYRCMREPGVPGGRLQALDGVSLEVGEGEVVGVVGETGSDLDCGPTDVRPGLVPPGSRRRNTRGGVAPVGRRLCPWIGSASSGW